MNKQVFVRERQQAWERFETLLQRAEHPTASKWAPNDVSEFSELFRSLCYDLAQARSRDWDSSLERYLNDLVVRGHGAFYAAQPRRRGGALRFFSTTFPRLVRDNQFFFWLAAAVFWVPLVVSWIAVQGDPSLAGRVLSGSALYNMEQMYAPGDVEGSQEREDAAMAGFYVKNNTSIAFQCFALGIFFGIGTLYVLLSNGITIGTVAGFLIARGYGERFMSFVVSHSSFELTAIVVSGAAGLILGHSLLAPGSLTRAEALRQRGLVAVQLALGAAGMLFVAAMIEGFWSAQSLDPLVKHAVGIVCWSLVIAYFVAGGRRREKTLG